MIVVELFDGTVYPIITNSRIAFGLDKVFLKSLSIEGEEVLVEIKKDDIQFIQELEIK